MLICCITSDLIRFDLEVRQSQYRRKTIRILVPVSTARFTGVIAMDGPSGTGKSTVARGVATRLGARYLHSRPHAISRMRLIGIALLAGLALVGGLPTTWPIVIGFGLVCAVLAAIILLGAAAGTH